MKRNRMLFVAGLACVLSAVVMFTGAVVAEEDECCSEGGCCSATAGIAQGNGYSNLADAKQAGAEAAANAKAAMGDKAPKVVLVFDRIEGDIEAKKAMLEGVNSVFDASIVYGCAAYAPITQDCNTGTVAVMALGGEIQVVPTISNLEGGHEACGKRIGAELAKAEICDSLGQVVLLFGACHVPANDPLAKGVASVLGENSVIGGGAAKGDFTYYQGNVTTDSNLGLLVAGKFTCGTSMLKDQSSKAAVLATAKQACTEALGGKKAALVLAFDCGGRRMLLAEDAPDELAAIREVVGETPVFGFYGSGETGHRTTGGPACGDGYHIAILTLIAK